MDMNAEYILDVIADEHGWVIAEDLVEDIIIPAMKEYGKQQWNEAIKLAAKSVIIDVERSAYGHELTEFYNPFSINEKSILKLLK